MTTGITAPFTSWHNFLQVNTELSKLQKIYSASRKIMSIFMIQTNGIEGRCKVKWSKQRSISRGWQPWRKYFSSSSTSSLTPLHWRAIISLTTKTRRGELGYHGIISMCGHLDSWEERDYSTARNNFYVCLSRWIPENGEMNFEIRSGIPDNISACFSLYINFNRLLSLKKVFIRNTQVQKSCFKKCPFLRYSSIVPIIDFRNNYEKGYVDQFYGERTSDLLQFNWKHLNQANQTSSDCFTRRTL